MKKIEAKIVADSKNEFGNRVTSLVCTFPRFILAELNTHRMFSRNSASSRAVPFPKMLQMVQEDPFIPIAWQEDHSGMQGTKYLDDQPASYLNSRWTDQIKGRDILNSIWARSDKLKDGLFDKAYPLERPQGSALYHMIECAKELYANKATKQLANRLLEPFMWHTCIITATEFENFFKLRCPQYLVIENNKDIYFRSKKDLLKSIEMLPNIHEAVSKRTEVEWLQQNKGAAEIHMMALAEAIWDALNESEPRLLEAGEWHIPFGDNLDDERLKKEYLKNPAMISEFGGMEALDYLSIKVATARCARVSYINYEGKDDYEADIKLYDRLVASGSDGAFHASPFEHCARAMTVEEYENTYRGTNRIDNIARVEFGWCRNFRGFISLRALIEK